MTMLIVEQGRTIESQRALIHELFRDNTELNAVRTKGPALQAPVAQNSQATQTQSPSPSVQAPLNQAPLNQAPLNQAPLNQAPTKQAPSSQAGPQHRMQNQVAKPKADFEMPAKPASDLADSRRNLITL
jgi:hypothetical protein